MQTLLGPRCCNSLAFQSRFPRTPGEGIYDGEEGIAAPSPHCNARARWPEPPPHPSIARCVHLGQGRDAGELPPACTMHREKGAAATRLGVKDKAAEVDALLFSSWGWRCQVLQKSGNKKKKFLNRKRGQDLSARATVRRSCKRWESCAAALQRVPY